MAKIIAILNHKGGVGKTTTSINLAAALQQKKKRVMVIDLDGQANLTESFGYSIEEEKTVYGALKGEYALPLIKTESGITLVPSCLDLSAAESELINEPGREMILRGLIAKLPEAEKFDYILIDCPPSLGLLTLNALTAADYLIIPVQAQFLAMRGMAKIMNVIEVVQERLNPNLKKLRSLWFPAKSLFRNMKFKRPGYKNRFPNTSQSLKTRHVSFKKRSRNWRR